MNIERLTDSKYIVFFSEPEAKALRTVAQTFHKGNKSATLKEIIQEGTQVSLSVKTLLEDKDFILQHKCPYCDNKVHETGKNIKGKDDDSKRTDAR